MLLYTSLFSILVSLLLTLNNWRVNRNAGYLGLAFLTIALYGITHHFLTIEPSVYGILAFYNHFTPLYLLTGPLVFFYVRGTLQDRTGLSRTDWLHFLPSLIQAIGITPWIFMPIGSKTEIAHALTQDINLMKTLDTNLFLSPVSATIVRHAHLMGYLTASLWWWWNSSRNKARVPARQLLLSSRWIAILLFSLLALDVLLFSATADALSKDIRESLLYSGILQGLLGSLFAALPLSLLFFPQILYGMPALEPALAVQPKRPELDQKPHIPSHADQPVAREPILTEIEEPFLELADRIRLHMEKNRPFTRPDYKMDDLALELGVPLNHIAYCLSEVMHQKFTAMRMAYRVQYSKDLLRAGKHEQYTIEGIALQAGFGSRSNFYSAFREITGMSPTEFIEQDNAGSLAPA